jgi:hypothetical protein
MTAAQAWTTLAAGVLIVIGAAGLLWPGGWSGW